ncbi:MAG: helix-turn-helix domain-containing protein [Pseudomonadota bacterium]|nr:helix-turn-helix domain-containing protein [Pseudomonadota bacterium]
MSGAARIEDFGHASVCLPFCDPLGEYRWNDRPDDLPRGVESLWIYGGAGRTLSRQTLTGHWKTCLAVFRQFGADGRVEDVSLRVLGPVTQPVSQDTPHGLEIIAARLFPEYAIPLLGLRPSEVSDTNPDWPNHLALSGYHVRRLAESGVAAETIAEALLGLISRQIETIAPVASGMFTALQAIREHNGQMDINALTDFADMSARTLRRVSTDRIGLSPKAYARYVRHQRLVQTAMRFKTPDWADLAYDFGFSDQAHMARDVKAMSGLTPAALHRQRTGVQGVRTP